MYICLYKVQGFMCLQHCLVAMPYTYDMYCKLSKGENFCSLSRFKNTQYVRKAFMFLPIF